MNFRVVTPQQTVTLTPEQLVELLVAKAVKRENKYSQSSAAVAAALVQKLEDHRRLGTLAPTELATIAIDVGYYLNTFFRSNEVEIENNNAVQSPADMGSNTSAG